MSLIWEPGTNSGAFQTGLPVQGINFFFTKTQNIQLFPSHKKLYRTESVEFLITEHIVFKNQT